jgi:hypothetical protein
VVKEDLADTIMFRHSIRKSKVTNPSGPKVGLHRILVMASDRPILENLRSSNASAAIPMKKIDPPRASLAREDAEPVRRRLGQNVASAPRCGTKIKASFSYD